MWYVPGVLRYCVVPLTMRTYHAISMTHAILSMPCHAIQAEELEQTPMSKDQSEKQNRSHGHLQGARAAASHGSADAPAAGRGHSHLPHRMAPPQHPLPRPTGHPPRPFVGASNRPGAAPAVPGVGEGGMGALLGLASQLRPPRVSCDGCRQA